MLLSAVPGIGFHNAGAKVVPPSPTHGSLKKIRLLIKPRPLDCLKRFASWRRLRCRKKINGRSDRKIRRATNRNNLLGSSSAAGLDIRHAEIFPRRANFLKPST